MINRPDPLTASERAYIGFVLRRHARRAKRVRASSWAPALWLIGGSLLVLAFSVALIFGAIK